MKGRKMCDNCGNDHPDLNELLDDADDKALAVLSLTIIGGLVESFTEQGYADPDTYKALSIAIQISQKIGFTPLTDRLVLLKMETAEQVRKTGREQGVDDEDIDRILNA
jgi:hypothetical protein